MYEVELKVEADHARVRSALEAAGAAPVDYVRQVDTYYDAPHREFAETDEALRLREETELDGDGQPVETTTKMTYKGPLVEQASKTREEHETAVDDPDAAAGILDGLGFEPAATVAKERERFELDGYTVTLDQVEGLGSFVEVDREGAESEIERLRAGAQALLRDLGLDPADQIRTSYLGLLLAGDT
ncbi:MULTISPECIES: class IV adenylate cyclase [Halolamina]|uniref:Adenylate cyclase, class 2 n=1 Tax=Halolamina pelagica TaxID=699431 RepID=A0A1I5MWM5_9EURY|nr:MULTISPECIES: class IV adenylate cyclase [Halolamina]NHX36194.1 class IV adenylate cyclase [Halolamina sp. R1-12]SFP13929.1 adenylate cyclase, class 2 [Halolamina pelagica]